METSAWKWLCNTGCNPHASRFGSEKLFEFNLLRKLRRRARGPGAPNPCNFHQCFTMLVHWCERGSAAEPATLPR
jgi:hypothetical protein